MADQTVIEYERNGDPETGLQDWDPIPPEILRSGSPLQRGHTYHETAGGIFTSGVWDCTPLEQLPAPYEADEFMIVLEGSIIIEHESGKTERFRAGDSFILPKGTPCIWRQDEYALKYWAIHNNPDNPLTANPQLQPIRVDPGAELPAITGQDPAMYESEVPDMGWLTLYRDPGGRFQAGVWDCSPMKRVATTIERSELMHILEGSGSITNADGVVFNFTAGDTFLVPVGMGYQWQNDSYVRKLFCSYTP
ncbi:MAG: cupin domain-containing protein [Gammaproteobacteria bacterium]|nr:cupin domain-containing protein [Gammaproteobacteria bacterium]